MFNFRNLSFDVSESFEKGINEIKKSSKDFSLSFVNNLYNNFDIIDNQFDKMVANVTTFVEFKLTGKDQICIGETCVDEIELKKLLQEN